MSRSVRGFVIVVMAAAASLAAALPAIATAKDYAQTARNIIPSGQIGRFRRRRAPTIRRSSTTG